MGPFQVPFGWARGCSCQTLPRNFYSFHWQEAPWIFKQAEQQTTMGVSLCFGEGGGKRTVGKVSRMILEMPQEILVSEFFSNWIGNWSLNFSHLAFSFIYSIRKIKALLPTHLCKQESSTQTPQGLSLYPPVENIQGGMCLLSGRIWSHFCVCHWFGRQQGGKAGTDPKPTTSYQIPHTFPAHTHKHSHTHSLAAKRSQKSTPTRTHELEVWPVK